MLLKIEDFNYLSSTYDVGKKSQRIDDYYSYDIEKKSNVIFDCRLYRRHTNIVNNDFVKDISKIGRDLSKIIIVDNMSQNYKLQPNNGICIRPFWGKDTKDMVLADLFNVLLDIATNFTDVRDGITTHKEDIISKITSNIFRRTQNY